MRDQVIIAREAARSIARLAADATAARLGRALPLSPAALTDPATMGRLLNACPSTVKLTSIESPSSNCQNSIYEITWPDGQAGPSTLFAKQPSADFGIQLFANLIGFWDTECAFAEHLSREVSIDTPHIHAVESRGGRFVILMENLRDRPDTRLFVNTDLLAGADLDLARRCLRTLAELHAGMSGLDHAQREARLPLELHPSLSPSRQPVISAVGRVAAGRCHRRAPEIFDATHLDLYRRALAAGETLSRVWYGEPLTLVHGDSHLGNFFEAGDTTGMIDFQGTHWGKGIRDVQYFLINSMQPDLLARHEVDLVAYYCEEVSRLGAPIDPTEGMDQYRGLSFQTLTTAVVALGLASLKDSDSVVKTILERSVAAVDRLEFGSWLDDRTRGPGHG